MQHLSFFLYLFTLVLSPLLFGTVENWSRLIIITVTAVSSLLLFRHIARQKKACVHIPGIIPLILLSMWILFQLIPLPPLIVKLIAPGTYELYKPILKLNLEPQWITLSLDPHSTVLMFCTSISNLLFYILTVFHLQHSSKLKQTVSTITILGAVIAFEAIIQKLTSPQAIYWFRATPSLNPMGPWVYSNHFAGFMGMLFPVVTALFVYYRPQVQYHESPKTKFLAPLIMPAANIYLLLGTGAVLIAVSILISLSRGGIITLCIAFLCFNFFSRYLTRDKKTTWALFLIISTVLMISWLGWKPILDEFGSLRSGNSFNSSGRIPIILDGLNIIKSYPVFGTGFGTFAVVYPSVQSVDKETVYDHAHNDYLELLTDGGIPAFILGAWFIFSVFSYALSALRCRRERYSILITSGALTGMLALLLHSFVDFQMYNGANSLYFFFFCGLAISAASTRLQFRTRHTLLRDWSKFPAKLSFFLVLAFLIILISYNYRFHKAKFITAPLNSIFLNHKMPLSKHENMYALYTEASKLNPFDAIYHSKIGQISIFLGKKEEARKHFIRAALLSPMSGLYLQQLGMAFENNMEMGNELIASGIQRQPLKLENYVRYGEWLIAKDKRQEALALLDQAMIQLPSNSQDIARFIVQKKFSLSELEEKLSPYPQGWYALGRQYELRKKNDMAELCYLMALENIAGEVQPSWFNSLFLIYRNRGEQDKAVSILRKGIEYLPEYVPFRIMLGDYYRQKNIPYRALEEYLQGLRIAPDNRELRKRINELRKSDG